MSWRRRIWSFSACVLLASVLAGCSADSERETASDEIPAEAVPATGPATGPGKPYSPRVSGHEPLDELVADLLEPLVARHGSSFGGFMAWELDQDPDGEHARALSRALGGG
jgi:hypothetical protein